jgi:GNAT superfamily N-acetyltransferase
MPSAQTNVEPTIELVPDANADELARRIRQALTRHNELKTGDGRWRSLVLCLTDASGETIGGLVGESFWNALYIEVLWVADEHRGRGYGRRLMQGAELEARSRGVEIIHLSTYSFQAPTFYERLGYTKFGELSDTPKGAKRMWYVKRLIDHVA